MDKVSLACVSVFLVILLVAQNVELVTEVFYENGDDLAHSGSLLDKTYYQDYQDYEYQDEQVSSLSLTLKLLPLIVINIVLFLVLFLAAVTTTAANGKRKRSVLLDDNFGKDAPKGCSIFAFPSLLNLVAC
ncbi:hypothetical protein OUZ56_004826 [Daphnia magna]|uniref:Uncharacterized protein n=1 Tax=Daphnia magna TaxID=35525 RepID=A0ABQ9YRB6_9CRUS|nr:hypothetical protein OUZ56_004826 [Daphnia magna]